MMIKQPTLPKRKFVHSGFENIADRYDLLNDIMTLGMHRLWKNEAVKLLHVNDGMTVLDLCSGTGDFAYRIQKQSTCHISSLDFSFSMMQAGIARNSHQENISWLCGDATDLPYRDQSFDRVIVGFGLRNVVDLQKSLQEVKRVLKPGGLFVSLDTGKPRWSLLQPFFTLYMNYWVPFLGKIITGNKDMYSYLASSAYLFVSPQELAQEFEYAGFENVRYKHRPRLFGGSALVYAQKSL